MRRLAFADLASLVCGTAEFQNLPHAKDATDAKENRIAVGGCREYGHLFSMNLRSPNKAGAGKGAGSLSFHVGRHRRALPDLFRSAPRGHAQPKKSALAVSY